jgi:hypothetical protein
MAGVCKPAKPDRAKLRMAALRAVNRGFNRKILQVRHTGIIAG